MEQQTAKLGASKVAILELLAKEGCAMSPTYIGEVLHPSGRDGSPWASPKCLAMAKAGLLHRTNRGHYSIAEAGLAALTSVKGA